MTAETDDAFLGGRLRVRQPAHGYRAGVDAVLLAASVPAAPGDSVLDLGTGAGVVLLCLAARLGVLDLTGIERQPALADLARRNARRNGVAADVHEADVRDLPRDVRARRFDHVVTNPPYLDRSRGKAGADGAREAAVAADVPLGCWVAAGWRRVRPGGWLHLIVPAARLPEVLAGTGPRGVSVRPVAARVGRDADRVLVAAHKGGGAAFRLRAPLVVHAGPAHRGDGDDFTPEVQAVLRDAAPLEHNY